MKYILIVFLFVIGCNNREWTDQYPNYYKVQPMHQKAWLMYWWYESYWQKYYMIGNKDSITFYAGKKNAALDFIGYLGDEMYKK